MASRIDYNHGGLLNFYVTAFQREGTTLYGVSAVHAGARAFGVTVAWLAWLRWGR